MEKQIGNGHIEASQELRTLTPEGVIFPDKKEHVVDFRRIKSLIQEAASISKELDVGQEEATVHLYPDYPELPVNFLWMTDIHFGNIGVDYDRLERHLEIVENTPNTYVIFGGDIVDNFSAAKHPVAMLGDAISPQVQTQAMMERIKDLDRKSKVLAIGYGNHEEFIGMAGYDYYQSFMGEMQAPIFNKNGLLNVTVGRENYRVAVFHKFWGVSKLNVTNSPKRILEYGGFSEVDIVLSGDDHQASAELFSKNGERKLAIDGGTYKLRDATGKRWGLGPAGEPGYSVFLWPNERRFEMVANPETSKDMMEGMILLAGGK